MSEIADNDPCPCGSGLQYGSCCLQRERAKSGFESGAGLTAADQEVMAAVWAFCDAVSARNERAARRLSVPGSPVAVLMDLFGLGTVALLTGLHLESKQVAAHGTYYGKTGAGLRLSRSLSRRHHLGAWMTVDLRHVRGRWLVWGLRPVEPDDQMGSRRERDIVVQLLHADGTPPLRREALRDEVEHLLLERLPAAGFNCLQQTNAIRLWRDFHEVEQPRLRSPKPWAAAIDYILSLLEQTVRRQTDVGADYNVSAGTVSSYYWRIWHALALGEYQERYTVQGAPELPEDVATDSVTDSRDDTATTAPLIEALPPSVIPFPTLPRQRGRDAQRERPLPTINEAVEKALAALSAPVRSDEFIASVLEIRPSAARLAHQTIQQELRFHPGAITLEDGRLAPTWWVMNKARFRCQPSAEEVRQAALSTRWLIGFIPPAATVLTLLSECGDVIGRWPLTPHLERIFGRPVPSLDLGTFYQRQGFAPGDSLLLTVANHDQAILIVTPEPAGERQEEAITTQNQALGEAIRALVSRSRGGPVVSLLTIVPAALSRVPSLRDYPGDHLRTVIEKDERLRLYDAYHLVSSADSPSLLDALSKLPSS